MRPQSSVLLVLCAMVSAGLRGQGMTAPAIAESPASVSATERGVASFRVIASGSAPLAYQWFHDGLAVAGATSAILVLESLAATEPPESVTTAW